MGFMMGMEKEKPKGSAVGCGERSEPHLSGECIDRCGSHWSPQPTPAQNAIPEKGELWGFRCNLLCYELSCIHLMIIVTGAYEFSRCSTANA